MNKITNFRGKFTLLKLSILCLTLFLVQSPAFSQDAEGADDMVLKGEKLFKANCKSCHSIGDNKVVGPGLKGISERHEEEWIIKWVTNSPKLIASGDPDAIAIFEEYDKSPMPPQPVTVEEIKTILAYIKNPPVKVEEQTAGDDLANSNESDGCNLTIIIIIIIVVTLILLGTLNKARVFIAEKIAADKGTTYDGPVTLLEALKHVISNNRGIVAVIVIVLFFGGLVDLMDGAFQIGVHQGYKPEQPIKFSHQIHAGEDKIDCNYCHSSARHSKTSGIPSLNVCMNCHKYITGEDNTFEYNGEKYPMKDEIQKIYNHLDYDPETQTYGDNPTPVKWVKIHNLPDHVFFSHAQHVTAGKQKCQTCHGPVEEMDVVDQHAPLTMGWCIECHKTTAVSTKGNEYYDDLHSRMPDEFRDKVMEDGKITVNEIGGLECAKCHY